MSFLKQRKREVCYGVTFGVVLVVALGAQLGYFDSLETPNFQANTIEGEEEAGDPDANLTTQQLRDKKIREYENNYKSSLEEAKELNKGWAGGAVMYENRFGEEKFGGYITGSRDWSDYDQIDYGVAQQREKRKAIPSSFKGHETVKKKAANRTITREINKYNITRLSSPYKRKSFSVLDQHMRLKRFANRSPRVRSANEADFSKYYSSAQSNPNPKSTIARRTYVRTRPSQTQEPRTRLWQLLIGADKEKKKEKARGL